jgi:hypothetical protein
LLLDKPFFVWVRERRIGFPPSPLVLDRATDVSPIILAGLTLWKSDARSDYQLASGFAVESCLCGDVLHNLANNLAECGHQPLVQFVATAAYQNVRMIARASAAV